MSNDLMSIMSADLTALFELGGLTVPVDYCPANAPGVIVPLKGIFDEAWCEVDPQSRAPISSTSPAVHMQAGTLPAEPDDADRLIIKGRTWRMLMPKPDGHGVTVYPLKEIRS